MSIAIDLTESARDQTLFDHPVLVSRPRTSRPVADEGDTAIAHSHDSSATRSSNETMMLAIQLAGTFMMTTACTATFAFAAWMLFSMAGSAMEQFFTVSPNQILQGMLGR